MSLGGSRDSEPPYLNTPRKIRPRENLNNKDPTGPSPNSRKLGRSLSRIAPSTLDQWLDHTERLDKFYKELIRQMEYKLEETTTPTHSTFAPVCSSPPQLVSFEGTYPRTAVATSLRVSAHKTRNPPERFRPYPARSTTSPTRSTTEPDRDIIPAPPGLKTSPSNITHELTPARKPATTKLTPEMVLSISQPSLSLDVHVSKTEGMSQTPSLRKRYTSSIVGSSHEMNKLKTMHKSSETHLRVSNEFSEAHEYIHSGEHEYSLPYNINLSSHVISRDAMCSNAVPTPRVKQEVSTTSEPAYKTRIEMEGSTPSTLPETPMECVTEHSTSILGSNDGQIQTPSLSNKIGEERRVYNSVVSIHAKDEDQHTPDSVLTAFVLPESVPSSSPIPNTHATSKSCPSTPSSKHDSPQVQREVRRTRDSTSESRNASERVQMTRSHARPSSSKPDSVSSPRELHKNFRSSLTKDDEPFKARNVDSRRETATTVSHSSSKPECLSVPRELQRNARSSLKDNELSKARKTDFHRKSPSKSPMETVTTVSRTL